MRPIDRQKAGRNGVKSLETSAKEGDLRVLSGSQALLSLVISFGMPGNGEGENFLKTCSRVQFIVITCKLYVCVRVPLERLSSE